MLNTNGFPCCGAATFGEHLENVAEGLCSRAKLSAILERALAAAEQIARAGAR